MDVCGLYVVGEVGRCGEEIRANTPQIARGMLSQG